MVERAMRDAAHAALFGLLCVIDGARRVDPDSATAGFELWHVDDARRRIGGEGETLHDELNAEQIDVPAGRVIAPIRSRTPRAPGHQRRQRLPAAPAHVAERGRRGALARPGPVDSARLEDDGATLITDLRVDREQLFAGLFHGIEDARRGARGCGSRRTAYGERVPGVIPENAVLKVEVTVLENAVAESERGGAVAHRRTILAILRTRCARLHRLRAAANRVRARKRI